MISINVMGGLGNQLFMIFATLAYGIQHNVKVVFPKQNCYYDPNRPTYWDTFLPELKIFTTENPENQVTEEQRAAFATYGEQGFGYRPFPDFGEQNICLLGYFQSPQYFAPVQSAIYQIINLSDKKRDVQNKHPQYFAENKTTISMHFRMGDYKSKRYYHPVMNYEYFEQALQHIVTKDSFVNGGRVLYLCEREDNDFVEGHIRRLQGLHPTVEFLKVDDQIPDYEQLLIMSCCSHNIMANSTFSWWGAYLNENPAKIVCYPSVWFGEYYEHTHDFNAMMLPEWVKIQAKPVPWNEPL
jgi:hypothetical protein